MYTSSCTDVGENDFTEPLSKSTKISYDNSWFGFGYISLSVQTDKNEYKCGELILITAEVDNQSNKTIRGIKANIQPSLDGEKYLQVNFTDRNIQENKSFSWNYKLQIPHSAIETSDGVSRFYLKVTVIVSFAKNVLIELPFKIVRGGSVEKNRPLNARSRGVQSEMTQAHTTGIPDPKKKAYPTVVQPSSSRRAIPPSSKRAIPPSYRHASPPSYRHAIPPSYRHAIPPSYRHASPPSRRRVSPPSYRCASPPSCRRYSNSSTCSY